MKSKYSWLKNLSLSLFFLTLIFSSQYYFDINREKSPKNPPLILPLEVARAADLGLDSLAGSYYWLTSIQYFGAWDSQNHPYLYDLLNLSTSLDPRFSYPYAFAALTLPELGQTDQVITLAKKGIEYADPDWKIPYYLASVYHIDKKDTKNAAKYFDIAAKTPGAPDNIQQIAASYGARPDLRSQTILIWRGIYENTNDEITKQRAEAYIYHYELLNFLENAAKTYKEKFDSYPDPIEKLVEKNILKSIPPDPFGFTYYIDSSGRARIKNQ